MDSLPIHIVDLVVAIILLVSAFFAYARGFVHELLAVAGWVGAIFAAIYGYPYIKPHARDLIENELLADIAGGTFLFVVTLLILWLLTHAISSRVHSSSLNALDRSMGFLFGLVRGAVLICLAFIAMEWIITPPPEDKMTQAANGISAAKDEKPADPLAWMRPARSMPLIETGATLLASLVPADSAEARSKAAAKTRRQALELIEGQKMFQNLISPTPKAAASDAPQGYNKKERQDMERLIESNN